jgi:RNA-directed DNA polymerase
LEKTPLFCLNASKSTAKATYEKNVKGQYQLVVSQKSWDKLKMNLKSVTRKTSPISLSERNAKLKEIHRGWVNYFRMANIHGKLRDIDSWVRNRLRYCIWHDWNRANTSS